MKKQTKKLLIIVAIMNVLVIGALFVAIKSNIGGVKTQKVYTFFFNEQTQDFNQDSELIVNNGVVSIDGVDFYGLPLYSSDSILLTQDTMYYPISEFSTYKVEGNTTVSIDQFDINFKNGKQSYVGERGFMYDGKNAYIFLQDVVIIANNKEIPLSALSSLYYDGFIISYYDYEAKSGGHLFLDMDRATVSSKNFSIYLEKGIRDYGQLNLLLGKNPDSYNSIFRK